MRRQLAIQHPLHEPDLQLFHQPGIAEEVFRALNAMQHFVQGFFRDGPDRTYTEDRILSISPN